MYINRCTYCAVHRWSCYSARDHIRQNAYVAKTLHGSSLWWELQRL